MDEQELLEWLNEKEQTFDEHQESLVDDSPYHQRVSGKKDIIRMIRREFFEGNDE